MIPKTAAEILASAKFAPPKKTYIRHNRKPSSFSGNPESGSTSTAQQVVSQPDSRLRTDPTQSGEGQSTLAILSSVRTIFIRSLLST
jgi:hypothetical protein